MASLATRGAANIGRIFRSAKDRDPRKSCASRETCARIASTPHMSHGAHVQTRAPVAGLNRSFRCVAVYKAQQLATDERLCSECHSAGWSG
jgi:hypothetical protein